MANRGRGYKSEWDQMEDDYNNSTFEAQYNAEASGGGEFDHCRLYITNIPKFLTVEGLYTAFSKYGTLNEVYLSKDPLKKYALVRFETPGEAKLAMSKLNRMEPLKLNILIAHKHKKNQDNSRDYTRDRQEQGTSSRRSYREDSSSVDSRYRNARRPDQANGDKDDDDMLDDEEFDVDMLDPEIHLELEQIKLKQLELQEKQARCKQRMLLIKQSKKTANLNQTTSSNRCILPDGRIVVRNSNERNSEHREPEATHGAGAGDSLKIPALQRVGSRACVKCGAEDASSFCARCGVTPYCSLVCQRRDWADRHRAVCHNLARLPGGRLEGQANNTTDDQSGIPPAAPLRRPYSPAKGGKPEFQRHDQNSDKQDKIFTPPGQNARQPARNNNFNRGRNNSYNRNRPMNDRRPQKQDSQEDESWEKGPTKPESTDDKPISPKKTPYPPKEYHKPNDATPKRNEPEVPKTVPQEPAKPESRNDKAPQTPVGSKVVKESKPPATLANVTPVKKALVPKNYLIELLSINDTVLLSVDSAASDCATKRSGFVCLSMHESYQEQYQQLCEDYVVDCEADTTSFTPAVGNLFSYLSSADGGWYRARLLAVGKAALLDAARLVKLESTTTCRALPEKYRNSPEFCCLLDAAVKIGDNLTCKILSKHNDGYKVHIENIETNTVVGEGVVSRWEPVVEYPAPQKPQIPEVIRPDVVNNSKVLLVDMTASDRAFVRSAEASALRKYDDVLQNVVLAAANASPLTEPPQQGQTVIGQFTDGLYYRALCKRTNVKQNKYLLEYIDFGNVEISCLEKIYPCPAEYDARSLPTLASLVCLPPGGLPLTPPAVDYIEKLKDSCAELLLTIPSGAKTAPSGSAVSLTVVKNNQSVNKRIEELCTPEWKKFEEKGGDVVDMESVMYTDLEYLELPAKGCEVEILDISTLEGGTVSGCERNVKHTVFDSLTDRMAEYCNSELGREPYLPKHEELCIAKFPPYPQWFRAVLLEQVPGDPEARVCYVDYGNVGLVAVAALRKMLPEFVRGHPAVASHLEIKDFPKDPTAEMLARGVQHMKINDEGRGVLRVSRCEKQEPGFYIVEAPELIAAMKG